MENFDIMTTATLRPELLKRTFDSHIKYLFKDDIKKARLIINVDVVGSKDPENDLQKIIDIIAAIPFRKVYMRVNKEPSFSRAFYWCLGQLEAPLTFILEEDWEMQDHMNFKKMIGFFDDSEIAHLRLSMFPSFGEKELKTWNKFCPWNDAFFEIPRNLRGTIGWAGHPSLNKTSFLLFFRSIINQDSNPEKQIKGGYPIILNSRFGVYHPHKSPPIIKDIGRDWMVKNGWEKKGIKAFFTEWQKAE